MRSGQKKAALLLSVAFFFVFFSALGAWQVQRRAWKLALIERVESRVHAAPAANFLPDEEYRHVALTGVFMHERPVRVQAVTVQGPGYWVLAPLHLADGSVVLINRGFVPPDGQASEPPAGTQTITGLLRLTEPGGSLLRGNDPAANRWFSRDVQAIGARLGLQVQPYFVDQDAHGGPEAWPVGGLTVIRFPNNHLQYAITWFALALLCAGAAVVVWRSPDNRGHAAQI
jgi:surfeit locus 1 family protein